MKVLCRKAITRRFLNESNIGSNFITVNVHILGLSKKRIFDLPSYRKSIVTTRERDLLNEPWGSFDKVEVGVIDVSKLFQYSIFSPGR